jgi:hypothetical protein
MGRIPEELHERHSAKVRIFLGHLLISICHVAQRMCFDYFKAGKVSR